MLYLAVTFVQVWRAARRDEAQPAEAIVVFGAAQYDGEPSPVLAARLDHAIELYERGLAPVVVVTGGNQPGDRFTEAAASAKYLLEHGVPDEDVLREVSGTSSWQSLAAVSGSSTTGHRRGAAGLRPVPLAAHRGHRRRARPRGATPRPPAPAPSRA